MKTIKAILIAAIVVTASAFTTPIKKQINTAESVMIWTGKKVLGSHTGTINFKEGAFEMNGDNITGGTFIVDMGSINVTDLKAGRGKEKLEGHLKSDDFFGVANNPTATLTITNATKISGGYQVKANITIKGKTEPVSFDLVMKGNTATTSLTIDRTKFGVKYGSGSFFDNLGDNTISDDFTLDISLKF